MVGTRASKGRFRRADAIWLCDGRVEDSLGHLQRDLEGIWRARTACEDAFEFVAGLGRQDYLQALMSSV